MARTTCCRSTNPNGPPLFDTPPARPQAAALHSTHRTANESAANSTDYLQPARHSWDVHAVREYLEGRVPQGAWAALLEGKGKKGTQGVGKEGRLGRTAKHSAEQQLCLLSHPSLPPTSHPASTSHQITSHSSLACEDPTLSCTHS